MKRCFDVAASALGLLVAAIPMAVISCVVRITSRGPAFFVQRRVGRHGRLFGCIKLRTMYVGSERRGTVTVARDSRITPVGRLLRRTKLDELPQLLNVLRGDMSFVGPRPDVPGYADELAGEARDVLDLRPGITGPATLCYRDEERLLAEVDNPVEYNDEVIWPRKVEMNLEYLHDWYFWRDLGYLVITACPAMNRLLRLVPTTDEFGGR